VASLVLLLAMLALEEVKVALNSFRRLLQ